MHQFPKGTYVKDDDGDFCVVLEELGCLRFLSRWWDPSDSANFKKMPRNSPSADVFTVENMNAYGFVPCTPEEAGMKEEPKAEI